MGDITLAPSHRFFFLFFIFFCLNCNYRQVKIWDLRRTYTEQPLRQPAPVHSFHVGATVTSLVLPSDEKMLYVSCTNNAIFAFDAVNYHEKPGNY